MALRVFISHSTRAKPGSELVASHAEFRERVLDRLRDEEGFEVHADVDIQPGAHWRELLFGRLDECNAAVVLVNEQALLRSPWVDFEIKVLGWRAWMEGKNFKLIVVPFGGVTCRQITQHAAWEAVALGEVQMIPSGDASLDVSDAAAVGDALEKIVAALRTLPDEGSQPSACGWSVDKLADFLKLEDEPLGRIAGVLHLPAERRPGDLRRLIARRLYETGPRALKTLLEGYGDAIPNDDLKTALEILSTYWVDPSASATLLKFCRADASKQIFAINGDREYFTPEAYIRQICCWRKPWPVITVDGKQSTEEVLEQIREALEEEFRKNLRKSRTAGGDVEPRLNEVLRSRLEEFEAPVFVALAPAAARDDALIKAIYNKYGNLRIILCTGTPPGSEPLPEVEMIKPEFDLQVETDAWTAYDATLSLLP